MIDNKYIKNNIDIIFDVEKNNLDRSKPFYYIEDSTSESDSSKPLTKSYTRAPRINLELKPEDNFRLEWSTYTTLKQLYNKIEHDSKTRAEFIDFIKEKLLIGHTIREGKDSHDYSSLAFYFLMKIGKNDVNIEALEIIHKKKKYNDFRQGLFEDILKFVYFEPAYFNDDTLIILKEFNFKNVYYAGSSLKHEFEDMINSIRYKKLKNELVGINEELNVDKEHIINIISKYGFPHEIESFLLEIDKINELPNWESINSGMISNLRYFFELLVENIANEIKLKTGNDYPKDSERRRLGNLRYYIKSNLELSSKDDKLISSFISILHKEGGHAFLSEKKYFLMTKNIGIEIAYFLLSKLDEFVEK